MGKPHAVLTADSGEHWRDSGPGIFTINSQRTSFWRSKERFRIPPGVTSLRVIADREPYGYAPFEFTAREGRHYHIRYVDDRARVALLDMSDSRAPVIIESSVRDPLSSGTSPANPTVQ